MPLVWDRGLGVDQVLDLFPMPLMAHDEFIIALVNEGHESAVFPA
jgi:hypothetical protein